MPDWRCWPLGIACCCASWLLEDDTEAREQRLPRDRRNGMFPGARPQPEGPGVVHGHDMMSELLSPFGRGIGIIIGVDGKETIGFTDHKVKYGDHRSQRRAG